MELNEYIDHTLLKPDATEAEITKLIKEAEEYKFASACVATCWLDEIVPERIEVPLTTVVGFPHGNESISDKIETADNAIKEGVSEIDAVINMGYVKSQKWNDLEWEIKLLREISYKKTFKYIVEVGYLTDDELFRVADLLIKHKFDFIKTCTGYGPRGVTVEDIEKIKNHVGDNIKIKASGGIRSYDFCSKLIEAGADRIGASGSIKILEESRGNNEREES